MHGELTHVKERSILDYGICDFAFGCFLFDKISDHWLDSCGQGESRCILTAIESGSVLYGWKTIDLPSVIARHYHLDSGVDSSGYDSFADCKEIVIYALHEYDCLIST